MEVAVVSLAVADHIKGVMENVAPLDPVQV
jgi:hypothetical protein